MPRFQKSGAATITELNKPTSARPAMIMNKTELARELRVSIRTVDNMMAQRIIPFVRATKRSIRFFLPHVLAALEKREVKEVA